MGDVIRFPLERRLALIAAEPSPLLPVEYVREPGWFGVRLRPEPQGAKSTITDVGPGLEVRF